MQSSVSLYAIRAARNACNYNVSVKYLGQLEEFLGLQLTFNEFKVSQWLNFVILFVTVDWKLRCLHCIFNKLTMVLRGVDSRGAALKSETDEESKRCQLFSQSDWLYDVSTVVWTLIYHSINQSESEKLLSCGKNAYFRVAAAIVPGYWLLEPVWKKQYGAVSKIHHSSSQDFKYWITVKMRSCPYLWFPTWLSPKTTRIHLTNQVI